MKKMNISETSIYFEERGEGQPLLLIAGLASDSQSWLPVIIGLSKYFRVITFDNRGVGRSPEDNTDITIQDMAEDAADLIKYLNLSSVDVLGHSMGGMIAMELAIKYPDLVEKLVLVATSPTISKRNVELFSDWVQYLEDKMDKRLWFRNLFYWIFSPEFFNDENALNQAVNMSLAYRYPQSDESFRNQVKAISEYNCSDELEKIKVSVLIMTGSLDLLFNSDNVNEVFKKIVNMQCVTIPKAAHSIHWDNPIGFTDAVIDFII